MTFDMRKDGGTTLIAVHDPYYSCDELVYQMLLLYTLDPDKAKAALHLIQSGDLPAAPEEEPEPGYTLTTDDQFDGIRLADFADSNDYTRAAYLRRYAVAHQDYLKDHPKDMAEFKKVYNDFLRRLPDMVAKLDERDFDPPGGILIDDTYAKEKACSASNYADFLRYMSKTNKLSATYWGSYGTCEGFIAAANNNIAPLKQKALEIARDIAKGAK